MLILEGMSVEYWWNESDRGTGGMRVTGGLVE
jgi:hypothetical protein